MFANIRMRIACKIAGFGIRMMPAKWRNKNAIRNLIMTGHIDIGSGSGE